MHKSQQLGEQKRTPAMAIQAKWACAIFGYIHYMKGFTDKSLSCESILSKENDTAAFKQRRKQMNSMSVCLNKCTIKSFHTTSST